jgi:hypothetical protein
MAWTQSAQAKLQGHRRFFSAALLASDSDLLT